MISRKTAASYDLWIESQYSDALFVMIQDGMMFCDGCDRGCHGRCLNPPVEVNVAGKYFANSSDLICFFEIMGALCHTFEAVR